MQTAPVRFFHSPSLPPAPSHPHTRLPQPPFFPPPLNIRPSSMESATALRFLHGAPRSILHMESSLEKPSVVSKSLIWRTPEERRRVVSSMVSQKLLLHVKASQNASSLTTNADTCEKNSSAPLEKKNRHKSIFLDGFQALIEEVCDQTEVAELKLKVGDFEMHLKRDVEISRAPNSASAFIETPITAPPIPSKPMEDMVPSAELKSTAESSSPFTNITAAKNTKLAALEAYGQNAYVLVTSPAVGIFQGGRKIKGQRMPPKCTQGKLIKDGQIIGYLDQFGNDFPVRSNVDGEVLKVLCDDGEAVGYGDPLFAVLPSFHDIKYLK